MSNLSAIKTAEGWLALISSLLVHCVRLLRSINVHVYDLVIHPSQGVSGVVARSGLEVKMVEEITSE